MLYNTHLCISRVQIMFKCTNFKFRFKVFPTIAENSVFTAIKLCILNLSVFGKHKHVFKHLLHVGTLRTFDQIDNTVSFAFQQNWGTISLRFLKMHRRH